MASSFRSPKLPLLVLLSCCSVALAQTNVFTGDGTTAYFDFNPDARWSNGVFADGDTVELSSGGNPSGIFNVVDRNAVATPIVVNIAGLTIDANTGYGLNDYNAGGSTLNVTTYIDNSLGVHVYGALNLNLGGGGSASQAGLISGSLSTDAGTTLTLNDYALSSGTINAAGNVKVNGVSALGSGSLNMMGSGVATISQALNSGSYLTSVSASDSSTINANDAGVLAYTSVILGDTSTLNIAAQDATDARTLVNFQSHTGYSTAGTLVVEHSTTIEGLNSMTAGTASVVGSSSTATLLSLSPNGNWFSYNGTISDGAHKLGLAFSGPGVQVLNMAGTYTGGTDISGGVTVFANAHGADALGGVHGAAVTVHDGGVLSGIDTLNETIDVGNGGHLAPADPFGYNSGNLALKGNVILESGANLDFQLFCNGANNDVNALDLSGAQSFSTSGPVTINLFTYTFLSHGESFTLIDGGTNASLSGVDFELNGSTFTTWGSESINDYSLSIVNNDLVLSYNGPDNSAVPEPSGYALLSGIAALGLMILRRRKGVSSAA